jgi:hypothetical protein
MPDRARALVLAATLTVTGTARPSCASDPDEADAAIGSPANSVTGGCGYHTGGRPGSRRARPPLLEQAGQMSSCRPVLSPSFATGVPMWARRVR